MSRVAGDALDLAVLAGGLREGNRQRRNVGLAMGAVGSIALLDIFCAQRTGEAAKKQRFLPTVDYSDRSGLPRGVEAARGAAKDFKDRAFSTPETLKPWKDGKPQNGWSEPGSGKIASSKVSPRPKAKRPGGAGKAGGGAGGSLQQAAGGHERDDAFRTGPTFTGKGNEGP